jgi:hypothetical protein
MTGEPQEGGGMGRRSRLIPVGAIAAVLVIAALAGIIGVTLRVAGRDGRAQPVAPSRAAVPTAQTGIVGRVLTAGGPAPGAVRPYPASEVTVIDSSGRVVALVPSQPDAAFWVDLLPGDYTVEARPTTGNPWFHPEKVSVHAGRWSRVDIYAQIR